MVVPAVEKDGHSWKLPVDNLANSNKPFMGIAVAVHNNEILFAEYNETKHEARFYSPRGGRTFIKDQFFLLQEDFMAFKRISFKEISKYVKDDKEQTVNGCTTVLFEVGGESYMPLLDKPGDRTQRTTVKKVATYFVRADTMTYWDDSRDVAVVQTRMKKFVSAPERQDRVEFLCRIRHVN